MHQPDITLNRKNNLENPHNSKVSDVFFFYFAFGSAGGFFLNRAPNASQVIYYVYTCTYINSHVYKWSKGARQKRKQKSVHNLVAAGERYGVRLAQRHNVCIIRD